MTAVLTQSRPTAGRIAIRPPRRLELYRPGTPAAPPGAAAPHTQAGTRRLVASPGYLSRPRRLDPAVYRRRRLLAAGLFLLAIAAVLIVAQLIQAGIGGGPLTTTGAAAGPGMIQAGTTDYVVRPGDTLWSIAADLAPGRDERPLVDQLARETHGAALYPGEVIPLPGR